MPRQTRSASKQKPEKETSSKKKVKQDIPEDAEEISLPENPQSIYDFTVKDIKGVDVPLENYKGHVCVIVNVASRCGHTKSNYEQFVELYDKYAEEKGLRILAFPCNQFGGQEPGDADKICKFAEGKKVKFDLFEKVKVNGKDAHPLWKFLKEKLPGDKGKEIKWNFTKFIVNEEGEPVERHQSSVKPLQLLESLQKLW